MEIAGKQAKVFKIRNRNGYAVVCGDHLTEGKTVQQAHDRMVKALRRTSRRKK